MPSRVANIGSLLKKIYRSYISELHNCLQLKGFTDLRPSFLEVLLAICESDGASIKEIGIQCGLKKQTMTSHLNELENRGYINRQVSPRDKREQNIFLTEYGEKFKLSLLESIAEIDARYASRLGEIEMDRLEHSLSNFHHKITSEHSPSMENKIQDVFRNLKLDTILESSDGSQLTH